MGVISDGGVHGHISHVIAAMRAITAAGVPVALHAITDGRDVAPTSAAKYLAWLDRRSARRRAGGIGYWPLLGDGPR